MQFFLSIDLRYAASVSYGRLKGAALRLTCLGLLLLSSNLVLPLFLPVETAKVHLIWFACRLLCYSVEATVLLCRLIRLERTITELPILTLFPKLFPFL